MLQIAVKLLTLSLRFGAGCASHTLTEQELKAIADQFEPVEEPTRSWAIGVADIRAQRVLDDFNSMPDARSCGGPFRLDQYARDATRSKSNERRIMVMYKLQVPVLFLGHPEHFAVFVSEEDGSTSVAGSA